MANDLNQCNFIGRLGRDVEMRYATNGDPIANFSIAVGHQWKSKDGEKTEETEWVRCVAFGKLAEICGAYLLKGAQVFVSGRMKTRKWQDREGADRYWTEIICDEMQMLGRAKTDDGDTHAQQTRQAPERRDGGLGDMQEDIPFLPRGFGGSWRSE